MGVLEMLNAALVLRIRLICYGVLIFFSFFIFIGVAVMKDDLEVRSSGGGTLKIACPLYCDVDGNRLDSCGNESNCNYPMAIAIIFQLLFLTFRIATLLLLLMGKLQLEGFLFSDLVELVYVVVDLVAFFLTFIGACILSAGTNHSKDEFEGYNVDDGWESSSSAAQAGSWISTFVWLFVGVVGFLFLLRSGKIPCLPGSGAGGQQGGATSGPGATTTTTTNQEPPPYNPDDVKY